MRPIKKMLDREAMAIALSSQKWKGVSLVFWYMRPDPIGESELREKAYADRSASFNKKIFHMGTDRRTPAFTAASGRLKHMRPYGATGRV